MTLIAFVGLIFIAGLNWDALVMEYKLWRNFKSLGLNNQGYREYEHLKSDIVMVLLPGGVFKMGSPVDEEGRNENEELQRKVTLPAFLIGKYEVSQGQWERIMEINNSKNKKDKLPVDSVTGDKCIEFCEKTELSLPTEEQWEYACRAGTSTPFSFGSTITYDQANFFVMNPANGKSGVQARGKTIPVGSLKPNQWGIFDMHGNVWEWCTTKEKQGTVTSDIEEDKPKNIMRGGSFAHSIYYARSAQRKILEQGIVRGTVGFRVVWNFD